MLESFCQCHESICTSSYSYPAHLEELLRQLAEVLYDVGQHAMMLAAV